MFSKDFNLLNEIYNQKIVNEMNLGPRAEQPSNVGLSNERPVRINLPRKSTCNKCSQGDEECEGFVDGESNTAMAKQSVFRLVKLSAMLYDLICKEGEIEPWVLAKITESLSNIESVYSYKDYEQFKQKVENDMINLDEETEADLYNSISSGGSEILTRIREILSAEPTATIERVLYDTISVLETKIIN